MAGRIAYVDDHPGWDRKPHKHDLPSRHRLKEMKYGTVWACDCGKRWIYHYDWFLGCGILERLRPWSFPKLWWITRGMGTRGMKK